MNMKRGRAWWKALSLRRRSPADGHADFADMGTAFGLDASISPEEFAPPPVPLATSEVEAHLARRLHRRSAG